MTGDGIYIGLSGNTKQLWKEIEGKPIGVVLAGTGKLLYDCFPGKEADELGKRLKNQVDMQNHSGGSILVMLQQLLDVLGSRVLNEKERENILNLKDDKEEKEKVKGEK